jgi:dihydroxyacetone kinase-like predicted kinase
VRHVYVHTSQPDYALAYALDIGRAEDIDVANLDQQVQSVASERETRDGALWWPSCHTSCPTS